MSESDATTTEEKPMENQSIAEKRFREDRAAAADKTFPEHDFALVATVAGQIFQKDMKLEDAVKQALGILDACKIALTERARKREAVLGAKVPNLEFPPIDFFEAVKGITGQSRKDRAELYFHNFLRASTSKGGVGMSQDKVSQLLENLKSDGFPLEDLNQQTNLYREYSKK